MPSKPSSPYDVSKFDKQFTGEEVFLTHADVQLSEEVQSQFVKDFSEYSED